MPYKRPKKSKLKLNNQINKRQFNWTENIETATIMNFGVLYSWQDQFTCEKNKRIQSKSINGRVKCSIIHQKSSHFDAPLALLLWAYFSLFLCCVTTTSCILLPLLFCGCCLGTTTAKRIEKGITNAKKQKCARQKHLLLVILRF